MDWLLLAQNASQGGTADLGTNIFSALCGGAGGGMAVHFAMKWVQSNTEKLEAAYKERDAEKTAWLVQTKASRDEMADLLKMVLATLRPVKKDEV
jgi:hypothetical protein